MRYALEDCDHKDVKTEDGDTVIENEELQLNCNRSQTMEDPTRDFVTDLEVQAIIGAGMGKSTFHRNGSALAKLVHEKLILVLQVLYEAP